MFEAGFEVVCRMVGRVDLSGVFVGAGQSATD